MNHIEIPAIKISQPFGDFFSCKFKAKDLLELTFSDPLRFIDDSGKMAGNQRILDDRRIEEIGKYIQTVDVAFPNSIIIAANYGINGALCEDELRRWRLVPVGNNDLYNLIIPTNEKLASVIDGQHRLNGFLNVPNHLKDIELLCSVYLDLPNPYQAQIFATINFNQKKVDKSLAYEQFGFNLDSEPSHSWSPEKLAVFFTRKLNQDDKEKSIFYNHIILAPQDDNLIFQKKPKQLSWAISTSTIVDCIISLFSTNNKRDKYLLHKFQVDERKRTVLVKDSSPFRQIYIANNDIVIYTAISNFFKAAYDTLISKSKEGSYIKKTVGVQALFDTLRIISAKTLEKSKDLSEAFYSSYLVKVQQVDFKDNFYQASGVGRGRIKNTILYANNLIEDSDLKDSDLTEIKRILKGSPQQ
ncbi:MAG: DGQHR domain-containing protein [Bacteroidetes bacterium]|nr:DGQHR domain-containing protein [Bacteroidota bacterium]